MDGNEHAIFDIGSCSGQTFLAKTGMLNFNDKSEYELTVQLTDSGTPPLSDEVHVAIRVLDANDSPQFTVESITFTVRENVPPGELLHSKFGASIPMFDPDANDSHTWAIVQNDDELFGIDLATGTLSVLRSPDFEFKHQYSITVQVTDRLGVSDSIRATILVLDENEPPELSYCPLYIEEMAENGTMLHSDCASTLTAFDPESGKLSFAIEADDPEPAFAVDSNDGRIYVNDGSKLDFETQSHYELVLRVTDGKSGFFSSSVQAVSLLTSASTMRRRRHPRQQPRRAAGGGERVHQHPERQ